MDGTGAKPSLWSVVSRKVHHVYVIRYDLGAPYGGGEVRRRFRDFIAFRDELDPLTFGDLRLPSKAVAHITAALGSLGSLGTDGGSNKAQERHAGVVEERRAQLQMFLREVHARHPTCPELVVFLGLEVLEHAAATAAAADAAAAVEVAAEKEQPDLFAMQLNAFNAPSPVPFSAPAVAPAAAGSSNYVVARPEAVGVLVRLFGAATSTLKGRRKTSLRLARETGKLATEIKAAGVEGGSFEAARGDVFKIAPTAESSGRPAPGAATAVVVCLVGERGCGKSELAAAYAAHNRAAYPGGVLWVPNGNSAAAMQVGVAELVSFHLRLLEDEADARCPDVALGALAAWLAEQPKEKTLLLVVDGVEDLSASPWLDALLGYGCLARALAGTRTGGAGQHTPVPTVHVLVTCRSAPGAMTQWPWLDAEAAAALSLLGSLQLRPLLPEAATRFLRESADAATAVAAAAAPNRPVRGMGAGTGVDAGKEEAAACGQSLCALGVAEASETAMLAIAARLGGDAWALALAARLGIRLGFPALMDRLAPGWDPGGTGHGTQVATTGRQAHRTNIAAPHASTALCVRLVELAHAALAPPAVELLHCVRLAGPCVSEALVQALCMHAQQLPEGTALRGVLLPCGFGAEGTAGVEDDTTTEVAAVQLRLEALLDVLEDAGLVRNYSPQGWLYRRVCCPPVISHAMGLPSSAPQPALPAGLAPQALAATADTSEAAAGEGGARGGALVLQTPRAVVEPPLEADPLVTGLVRVCAEAMPPIKGSVLLQRRAALLAVQACALVPLSTVQRQSEELLGESRLLTKAGVSLLRMKAVALPAAKMALMRSLSAARGAQRGSGSGVSGIQEEDEAEGGGDGRAMAVVAASASSSSSGDETRRRAALMEVACCQQNLGAVMSAEGDLPAALRLLRDALAATEEAMATSSSGGGSSGDGSSSVKEEGVGEAGATPEVEALLNNLGTVCHASKAFAESRGYFERALAMQRSMYGSGCGATMNNIGANYLAVGNRGEARRAWEEALVCSAPDAKGRGTPRERLLWRVTTLTNLAKLVSLGGDLPACAKYLEGALEILQQLGLGDAHRHSQVTLENLAGTYEAMHDFTRAGELRARLVAAQ